MFLEDNSKRGEWTEERRRPPADRYVRPRAEVVYVTGCVSAYFPLAQKIRIARAESMEASGVDFTLLGEKEWCWGFPLHWTDLELSSAPEFLCYPADGIRRLEAALEGWMLPEIREAVEALYSGGALDIPGVGVED